MTKNIPSLRAMALFPHPLRRGIKGVGFFARICIFIIVSYCYDFAKNCKNLTHGNPHSRRHCERILHKIRVGMTEAKSLLSMAEILARRYFLIHRATPSFAELIFHSYRYFLIYGVIFSFDRDTTLNSRSYYLAWQGYSLNFFVYV